MKKYSRGMNGVITAISGFSCVLFVLLSVAICDLMGMGSGHDLIDGILGLALFVGICCGGVKVYGFVGCLFYHDKNWTSKPDWERMTDESWNKYAEKEKKDWQEKFKKAEKDAMKSDGSDGSS